MIKVVHVIKSLELGGAETVLRRLIEGSDPDRFSSGVISLTSIGPVGDLLLKRGVSVQPLGLNGSFDYPAAIPRLAQLLRQQRPDVVQTWMYHADLIGGLAARMAGVRNVVWGIHAGSPPVAGASILERVGLRTHAALSHHVPARTICCSHTTARVHTALGYDTSKMVVVPNGFPLPMTGEGAAIADDDPVVVRVGRDHPDKDIPTFLRALQVVRETHPTVKGVLVGPGLHRGNRQLVRSVEHAELGDHVDLLGPRNDIDQLLREASVAVSSSSGGEGLPLAVGEAMAAGTPVVTTDVGDSALVLDDETRVVRPGDHVALADAIRRLLDLSPTEREDLGRRDRNIISERWSLARMIDGYCQEYLRLAAGA